MTARRCPHCSREVPPRAAFCPYDGVPLERGRSSAKHSALRSHTTRSSGAIIDGRYRIEGFVDRGATARVYLAEDLASQKKVALKVFAPSAAMGESMRARFAREAKASMAIDHPHVVRVIDTGTTSMGAPYLVLEPLPGEPLGERLRVLGKLTHDFALRLSMEAASGLVAAHALNVVHRDVKPDNLFLVRRNDGTESVKVIDFGMAKTERSSGSSAQGVVLGTLEYMAPEQIVCEEVDARTDVYGLGVVMYRMFTGHLPFDLEQSAREPAPDLRGKALLAHQLFSPVPPPSWLDERLDSGIERVILCATRKRRENRYPTMEALRRDLQRVVEGKKPRGQPLAAEPDVFEPASKMGREAAAYLSSELGFRHPRRR